MQAADGESGLAVMSFLGLEEQQVVTGWREVSSS